MIKFFMVDVKDIQAGEIKQDLSGSVAENLADAILATGGLVKPLILKRVGLGESYQLIDGHLEYYAALQAKAKDPRKGEMVNAFVISPDQEDLVRQQLSVLQSASQSPVASPENSILTAQPSNPATPNDLSVMDYTPLESRLNNKLTNYTQAIQSQLQQNQQDLQIALQKMQSAWEATLNNQLRQQREEIQAQLRSHSPSTPPVATSAKISNSPSEVREKTPVTKNGLSARININEVKTTEELLQLKKIYDIKGLGPKTAEKIISLKEKLGSEIQSLNQLTEAGVSISDIRKWSHYFTC